MYTHDLLVAISISATTPKKIKALVASDTLRLICSEPILLTRDEESAIRGYLTSISSEEFVYSREVLVLSSFIRSCKK